MGGLRILLIASLLSGSGRRATCAIPDGVGATNAPSKFLSAEDGWTDISGFLDEKHGFLPVDGYGIGDDALLGRHPLRYCLQPERGTVQGKYRLGESPVWAGISYAFAATKIGFEAPEGTPGRPAFRRDSDVNRLEPTDARTL